MTFNLIFDLIKNVYKFKKKKTKQTLIKTRTNDLFFRFYFRVYRPIWKNFQ